MHFSFRFLFTSEICGISTVFQLHFARLPYAFAFVQLFTGDSEGLVAPSVE